MRKSNLSSNLEFARELHGRTPPDWYYQSFRVDPFQRYWHKRRFEEVGKLIESVRGGVLDLGCADGVFSKVILDKTKAKSLVGIDVLEKSVAWANKHWGRRLPAGRQGKMKFMAGDAHNLDFKSQTFDAVFSMEMLEHVVNPQMVLKEAKRVLKEGGYAVFLVPTDSLLFRIIWFLWLKFYPRGWVWRDTHIQTYRSNYLPKLCKKVGFKIDKNKKFLLGMLQAVKVRKT